MSQKLLTLPFRLGFGAARTALDISTKTLDVSVKLAQFAIETVLPSGHDPSRQGPAPDSGSREPAAHDAPQPPAPQRRQSRESRVNGHAATTPSPPAVPAPRAPIIPPDEQPATPLSHEQEVVKTLEDEEELVAEFAEPGAEDGAGAQLDVEEPWEGYAHMNAAAVISRIDQADQAALALLELYEQTHKKRQTVLAAATKRLRALSPPGAAPEVDQP